MPSKDRALLTAGSAAEPLVVVAPTSSAPSHAAEASAHEPPPAAPAAWSCPAEMRPIPAGEFWMGAAAPNADPDEMPRFRTKVGEFCLDRTEVRAAAFGRCEAAGVCRPAGRYNSHCSASASKFAEHPINCVDWQQAVQFCSWREARLPSEVEWEYAAKGGAAELKYPWGDSEPDGHTCWKQGGSCKVASFAAGAFGLFDMSGNVWEWTADDFGAYPWPPLRGVTKIYRGGSFSRRFDKWLRLTLRNRYEASKHGSHLGFRCAKSSPKPDCPYGEHAGQCLRGVETAECPRRTQWNGVRCARAGEPRCLEGTTEKPGFGCVVAEPGSFQLATSGADASAVVRQRSAEFDADCRSNQPQRPLAYRYSGGTHHARNELLSRSGCQNRDVGIGWNSSCCPE